MHKFVTSVKKKLKINIWKIKNIVKLEIIVIIQENIGVLCIAYVIQTKKCLSLWIMDDWENFNETALPEKQDFYSH